MPDGSAAREHIGVRQRVELSLGFKDHDLIMLSNALNGEYLVQVGASELHGTKNDTPPHTGLAKQQGTIGCTFRASVFNDKRICPSILLHHHLMYNCIPPSEEVRISVCPSLHS